MPRAKRTERGELQAAIMDIVWDRGETTVRDVHAILSRKTPIAYTTVMTVMTRLAAKKILKRRRAGSLYAYRAAATRDEQAGQAIASILARMAGGVGTPVMAKFVDAVGGSAEKLDELARLIEQKRKGMKR
jgi:predicted transcriptional regulator